MMMNALCRRGAVSFVLLLVAGVLWAQPRPAAYRSEITPAAPTYALPVNLAGVTNADAVQHLTAGQKQRLAEQGFVIVPDNARQMFYLYEDYASDTAEPIPNFITVDSLLHAYHLFFDYSLRTVENNHLYAALTKLTTGALSRSQALYKQAPAAVQDAARRNAVFFAVAQTLLSGKPAASGCGPEAEALLRQELGLVAAHAGRSPSPLLGTTVHYSQFIPRGHYTRNDALRRYFMAMMWYGSLGLALDPDGEPDVSARHTLQALLITRMLAADEQLRALWARIYEPTSFFVGTSDDLGYRDYTSTAQAVYGTGLPLAALADPARLQQFLQRARAVLPPPAIAPYYAPADASGALDLDRAKVQGRQFRFMGQRFIPDSYILQNLVSPLVRPAGDDDARDMPMGLDVMAALGSSRAVDLLLNTYKQGRYPQYAEQLQKLRGEFAAKPEAQWWHNLYWGWLYSFQAILGEFGQGYPAFMRGTPWQEKELQTALGSWSQLRHDTILYGKPSGAEMGGGEDYAVKGYVEPVPEAFARLAYLTALSERGLRERGLLDKSLSETYGSLKGLLLFLKAAAEKELLGQPLSAEGYERIRYFGGELERLQLSVVRSVEATNLRSWYEITNETDKNMPTIADIHTSFDSALEVGVGPAYRLYVVTTRPDGKLQVTKGGVFSYFEFAWPASDRLTDEKWQKLLGSAEAPQQQEWLRSLVVGPPYPHETE